MNLILVLTFSLYIWAEQVLASEIEWGWKALLHEKNGQSQIQTDDFFLTSSRDSLAELEQLRQNLLSPEGNSWACRFPARTKWILANSVHNDGNKLPTLDFKNCSELKRFRNSFGEVDAVSLIFASEVPSVPSSAFGHTVLVFHKGSKVTLDSTVIEYAAEVNSTPGFVEYLWKGLSGGFFGVFTRQALFKKLHIYSKEDRRRLFSFRLNLTSEQIEYLIDHLYELRDMRFRYYFLTQNCGYQLEKLLETVKERNTTEPFFYGLPIESLMHRSSLAQEGSAIEPLEIRTRVAINNLTSSDQVKFENTYFKEEEVPEEMSSELRKALNLYVEYDFRTNRKIHPRYSFFSEMDFPNDPLSHRYISTTENSGSAPYRDNTLLRGSRRVMLQYSPTIYSSQTTFWLDFRPVLKDLREPQLNPYQDSAFLILNPRLRLMNSRFDLDSLVLLEITSLPHQTAYVKNSSWRLYSALDRTNPIGQLRFTNEYGVGKTIELAKNISAGALLGVGFETSFRNLNGFVSAEIYQYMTLSSWIRAGARAKIKLYPSSKHLLWSTFIRGDFIKYALELEGAKERLNTSTLIRLGVLFYF